MLCNDSGNKCTKHTATNQQPETSHGCEGECPAAVVGCKVDVVVYVVVVVLYVASRKHEAPIPNPKSCYWSERPLQKTGEEGGHKAPGTTKDTSRANAADTREAGARSYLRTPAQTQP